MTFVFIHGPPAVGKLTVARETATRTGYRLLHNHLVVDLALALHDFGTPGFVALREQLWWSTIRHAFAARLPGLIFTFNAENSVPQRFLDELFAEIPSRGGKFVSVGLTAPEAVIEQRLAASSRQQYHKLTDPSLYRKLRAQGVFAEPRVPRTDLLIDTAHAGPAEAAAAIGRFLERS